MTIANMNDVVEVILTKYGAEVYNELWNYGKKKVDGDIHRCQLWSLMQDFGGSIHLGMVEVPFKDCKIVFIGD